MGKGYNNYMCKKFFHPSSKDNQKRLWQAQKKHEGELAAQADLRAQYDKEQELYQNKSLLSKESKDKLEVNFMYEPPPGVKKISANPDDDEGEPEYKFEWQRTWGHAPKESYLADGDQFAEQPFGIQVCQAKCMKCGAFGHMNIDKRCPLYGKAHDSDAPLASRDSDKLITEMRQEGMAMRYNTWNMGASAGGKQMEMVDSVPDVPKGPVVDRAALLKGMSKEEKKALLKKLEKMEKKKEKKQKKKKRNDTSDEDSDDGKVKVKKEPESVRRDVKREPESRRGERDLKREPESRRGERDPKREYGERDPESRRGEREIKREPESSRRSERRSRSRGERKRRSRSSSEEDERSRSRSVEKSRRRRSYSRDEERKNRRDRSRDRR